MSQEPTKLSQSVGGLRCAAVSDIGMRRSNNQDSLAVALAEERDLFSARGHLFVVADGMGAHAAGELASQIAVENIPHAYHKLLENSPCEALTAAVHDANTRIHTKGQNSVDFQGMGTTCSCLAVLAGGAIVAHVGDSRVYRLRNSTFEQLTFDHSLVWEMAAAGQASEEEVPAYVPKNVITRSLGPNLAVKVDLEGPFELQSGDRFLLCSDGLTGPLNSQLIGLIVSALPPDEASQTLVDLANLLGGPDNITVIITEVTSVTELGDKPPAMPQCDPPAATRVPRAKLRSTALATAIAGGLTAIMLWSYDRPAYAAIAAGVTAVVTGLLSLAPGKRLAPNAQLPGPQGKAPYRRYDANPSTENIEPLSDIVRQLEDLEAQRDWQFDWQAIHEDRGQAHQAIARGDFQQAVVSYSSAVRRLMQAVRESGPEPPSDSSINLGVD